MATAPALPVYSYAYDPTGTLAANLITGEQQVITAANAQAWHTVVPDTGPFFIDDFSVSFRANDGTVKVLKEGIDYNLGYYFKSASLGCRKAIYGSIALLDQTLFGVVVLNYRTLGGPWVVAPAKIYEALSNTMRNPRTVYWEQVANLPYAFPPVAHPVDISALKGMENLCDELSGISTAIAEAAKAPKSISPVLFETKRQVGLGNVDNFPTASEEIAITGVSARHFMTPAGTRAAIAYALLSFFETYEAPLYSAAMPTAGVWKAGQYVTCSVPTFIIESKVPVASKWYGVKYVVRGWARLTDGNGNVAGTDWLEDRVVSMQ